MIQNRVVCRLLRLTILMLLFNGCGGSGNSKGVAEQRKAPSYLLSTSEVSRDITLTYSQNIIAEGSCVIVNYYGDNSEGEVVNHKESFEKGSYKFTIREYFNNNSNSMAILYYKESSAKVKDIPIDSLINITNRVPVLYRLVVDIDKHYVITHRNGRVKIFNSELNEKIVTSSIHGGNVNNGESFELKKGIYYIKGDLLSCNKSASFSLIEI